MSRRFFIFELLLLAVVVYGIVFEDITPDNPSHLLMGLLLHVVASGLFAIGTKRYHAVLSANLAAVILTAIPVLYLSVGVWDWKTTVSVFVHMLGLMAPGAQVWVLLIWSETIDKLLVRF